MFSQELLQDLYQHMEWADAAVWTSLGPMIQAGETDDRLHSLLYHMHYTQRAFLGVWTNTDLEGYDPSGFATLADMHEWVRSYHQDVQSFLATLDETRYAETTVIPWVRLFENHLGGKAGPTNLGETLMQVTQHTTYHRGQVNARLRELEGEPQLVDYIAWIWKGRPVPEWMTF